MQKKQKLSFTTGEFANMVGVNKRTLHFYDEKGIFKPAALADNGYRSYSLRQVYPFYMIRMLRDMGLDLREIQQYMSSRTPEKFLDLLTEQEAWLHEEIEKLHRMQRIVQNQRQLLELSQEVTCDIVQPKEMGGDRLFISTDLRDLAKVQDWNGIERLLAAYMREVMENHLLNGYTFGAMTAAKDLLTPGREYIFSYYSVQVQKFSRAMPKAQRHLRPRGTYLVIYFRGDYMNTAPSYAKLRAYMQEHHLQPIGYAYEESLLEEMSTAESKNFLTRIALPVALAEK